MDSICIHIIKENYLFLELILNFFLFYKNFRNETNNYKWFEIE